jgi:hypothetical protein
MRRQRSLFFKSTLLALLLGIGAVRAQGGANAELGTTFTYQGRLSDAGQPASGRYDFQFILYTADAGGNQVGPIVKRDNISVDNGLFSVSLDFGAVFDGTLLYLEMGVKPAGSASPYTVLLPRQALAAAPYALYAQRARSADEIPLAGSGSAASAAHSDHEHFGQTWRGAGSAGLTLDNSQGSGLYFGLRATVGRSGTAIRGDSTGDSSAGYGVVGTSLSPQGRGVLGILGASGVLPTARGAAIEGRSVVPTGPTVGVIGQAESPDGVGVSGYASAASGQTRGVSGSAASPGGVGVYGYSSSGGSGVVGKTDSPISAGYGVQGSVGAPAEWIGMPRTLLGAGVFGTSDAADGVIGASDSGKGIYGLAGSGYAGYFDGNVQVNGTLTKAGGSFKIDHPLDPANKYLSHSFVESPDMLNIYNGNVTLDSAGTAVVTLPDWFEALNQDFRYQLTPIGAPGPNLYIAQEIQGNHFTIAGGAPGMAVSWLVTGIRHDAWANAHRIPVEEDKPANERGTYLHPAELGQPASLGLGYEQQQIGQAYQLGGK